MKSTLFHEVYRLCTEQYGGAFVPHTAARLIAQRSRLSAAVVEHELTSPVVFLYDDVHATLDRLFQQADTVPVIWTEGELTTASGAAGYQLHKIEASALLQRYPEWRIRAERWGLPPICGGFSKKDCLAGLQPALTNPSIGQILVVDDNPAQLSAAGEWLSARSLPHQLLHINREINREEHQPSSPAPGITHITSLTAVQEHLSGSGIQVILIDLDYTLIDHAQTRDEMAQRIARLMDE